MSPSYEVLEAKERAADEMEELGNELERTRAALRVLYNAADIVLDADPGAEPWDDLADAADAAGELLGLEKRP